MSKGGMQKNWMMNYGNKKSLPIYVPKKNSVNCELGNITRKLNELNIKLRIKCPQLSISAHKIINNNDDLIDMVMCICLNENLNECIAKIDVGFDVEEYGYEVLTIHSETNKEYQGKKYNKFLRAVVIVIIPFLVCSKKIKRIVSTVLHPVSAWLLINYFGGKIDTSDDFGKKFINFKIQQPNMSLKDKIFNYFKKKNDALFDVIVDLTPENLRLAQNVFDGLLESENGMKC